MKLLSRDRLIYLMLVYAYLARYDEISENNYL